MLVLHCERDTFVINRGIKSIISIKTLQQIGVKLQQCTVFW